MSCHVMSCHIILYHIISHIYMYVYNTHIHIYIYIYLYVDIVLDIYIYIYNIHIYIYIHIHIYIYIYIYIYRYIDIVACDILVVRVMWLWVYTHEFYCVYPFIQIQVVVVLNDLITLALYLSWASLEGTRNSPAQQLGQENVSCSSFRGASGIVWDLETEVTGVCFWDNENHGFGEHELAYQVKWARCWLWFASALRLRSLGQAMKIMIE